MEKVLNIHKLLTEKYIFIGSQLINRNRMILSSMEQLRKLMKLFELETARERKPERALEP